MCNKVFENVYTFKYLDTMMSLYAVPEPLKISEEMVPHYVSPVCCANRALTKEPMGGFTWHWFSMCLYLGQICILSLPT